MRLIGLSETRNSPQESVTTTERPPITYIIHVSTSLNTAERITAAVMYCGNVHQPFPEFLAHRFLCVLRITKLHFSFGTNNMTSCNECFGSICIELPFVCRSAAYFKFVGNPLMFYHFFQENRLFLRHVGSVRCGRENGQVCMAFLR